jgi:signal transduction histidine kinase
MGNSFQHLLGSELYQRRKPSIEEVLAGNPVEIEDTFESSPGVINHLWIHYIPNIRNGVTEGFFVLVDDIRELKVTQTQLEAQQGRLILNARMAQMGEMLSLIAHQWRQPLTVVSVLVGNIQLKSQLGGLDVDYLMPKLDKINQTVHSLSGTIESFRSFYAPTKTKEDSDLLEVTSKALEFLSPVLRKQSLEVRYDPPSSPVFSWVLRAELMQVIVEILTNAVFALTPKGGWISLEWTVGTSEANLAIANNGGAIPEMDLPKIFLPDFTTKTDGSGTGLGLYMARVIIESHHGGRLNAEVANDITTFRITLPLEETRK